MISRSTAEQVGQSSSEARKEEEEEEKDRAHNVPHLAVCIGYVRLRVRQLLFCEAVTAFFTFIHLFIFGYNVRLETPSSLVESFDCRCIIFHECLNIEMSGFDWICLAQQTSDF